MPLHIHTLILIGHSSPSTLRQIPAFFLHNTVRSHRVNCARNDMYFEESKRTFFICPIPYPRDRTASNNSPPRARRAGLVPGVARGDGNKSNWTMHYNFKNGKSSQSVNHSTKLETTEKEWKELQFQEYHPGGRGTPYYKLNGGPKGVQLSDCVYMKREEFYELKVYEREGKSVILVRKKTQKG